MSEFKKVVVAYDDSEGSKKALRLTKEMAKVRPEMMIIVVHVFEDKVKNVTVEANEQSMEPLPINNYPADGIQVPPLAFEQRSVEKAEHAIVTDSTEQAEYNARLELSAINADVKFKVLEGNPAESICDYAGEVDADLIIIGHSSTEGLKRKLLGGVSQKVANHSPCHVLIAK
ncbi:universal stress protein [Bacillus sp. REN3]|uniref:universal stress protein n=1 Tax=Bacillus sp. REN3 TaxID=2802440 RepID=UPI001AED3E53|nr:universal stress protein [Bacillus sp. REN3]